ncbi:hypothetical protein BDW02DRAFT_515685 [Decorospora gaudefroyi]|uniref:TPR-like protein n=1 Tax=Decorospora gaudefroyi TaxID=184978 RepID=A0A6A5KU12_9PLEO|nr:hypothetical protein BDW02DRAFT_515685 [Decorospora gaudefroyi]
MTGQVMLERASTCLESGACQLFRTPKPCLPSRRFPTKVRHSTPPHGAPLDFLYPRKTLALRNQLSIHSPNATRIRHFSAVGKQPVDGEANVDAHVAAQAREGAARSLRTSDAAVELRKVLRSSEPGKQELAWQLYTAIPEEQLADQGDLPCDLLEYLVLDGYPTIPNHVLEVFEAFRDSKNSLLLRPTSYRAAVMAYISLNRIGPAISLLEDVDNSTGIDMWHFGTDIVLQYTVSQEQWDLVLRVFRTFLEQTPTIRGRYTTVAIRYGNTLPELWREVAQLPELLEHLDSFLRYVREFSEEIKSSPIRKQQFNSFVMTFVPCAMNRVLFTKDPDEDFIWDYFLKLFDTLHSLDLPLSACYEYAIKRMLELPRYQTYINKRKIWLELYKRYRERYLENVSFETRPSQNLIRNLIFQQSAYGLYRVEAHVQDLRAFYPQRPLRPGLLRRLIQFYAIHGDVERLRAYIDELKTNYKDEITIEIVSSLPYAYAQRADVDGTIAQFKRIHEEYGMTPDTTCWNILLLAYIRADDLDGSLECLNNAIECGVVPDVQTYGPLLDFCAQRGDVEAFEALFSRAKRQGVHLEGDVRARSGYVKAFLNVGDPVGAEAIADRMLQNWQAGTLYGDPLTHTWNLLIQHHALNCNLPAARQLYRQMVENNIPLDTWTYGSLMRALIEVKQTNAAWRILRVTMPDKNVRVHALHYAIVITGFLREKQVPLAMAAYKTMKKRNVTQTEASRKATLQALGVADLKELKKRRAKHPNYRLLRTEESLEEMLATSVQDSVHEEPTHNRSLDSHNFGSVPQAYYGLMISLYSTRSALKICRKLIRKAEEAAPDSEDYITPLSLLTSMMDAHLKSGMHSEVYRCWRLARETATKLTKTFSQAVQPASTFPELTEFGSLVHPSVQERFQTSRIANNRRHILNGASRIFFRSLFAQSTDSALELAQTTIHNLLTHGFVIDNFVWNEFIQHLAARDRLADAFSICEVYLMPRFPGWRDLHPGYKRFDRTGYQWMELRHYEITKTGVLPRYKTLVLLAKAYERVKRDERNGLGYDEQAQAWLSETLERGSPMTIRAIETMPVTSDKLQEREFHGAL